jgi:hypothetical protein
MPTAVVPSLPTPARSDAPEPGLRIGVDTHADVHVAAAIDQFGRLLATTSVPTSLGGLRRQHAWAPIPVTPANGTLWRLTRPHVAPGRQGDWEPPRPVVGGFGRSCC